MPDYRITDPDNGDVVVITGDRQPTRKEALKAFGMMRQQRSEQQVAGMTGDDLSEVVYGNPAVEYPDHVLRKLYDHEQTRSTDWWKVAKGLPGAAGRAVKDLAVNTGTAVFQEAPELIGQAFNDPAKAAGTAANTFAEFGARQVEELKMLPPVYAAQLDMLNRKLPRMADYHAGKIKDYRRQKEQEAKKFNVANPYMPPKNLPNFTGEDELRQENPALFNQLKKEYDEFIADERFKNWKQIFLKRQADSLKAAEVQSGKTSYVAEAAGGKEALEALTGSSEVMGSGAQVATDLFGIDVTGALPIGKLGGKALGTTGKFDNLATRAGKAVSKGVDKFAAGTERVTKALADAGGDNIVLRLSLSTPAATAITASQLTDTVARLAEVAAGGSVSRAARKARTRTARGILGASDNAFIEGMLQRVGQGLDEAIPAAGRGAAIGTLMGLGSVNDQQLAESIGGQAGFGGALGGVTGGGLGFTKIQQFNKANELLAKMDPDVREDFMASRLTALQGEANPQAAFIDEMAAISYINEDLAPDGVRVTVATPEQIVQMMRDQGRDEAFAVDAAQQQGVTFQNPVNNQTVVVVNSEYAQHMGKTAIHEVFHSFDHHDGEVDKNGFIDRIRAAWNEETPETGTVKGERIRLMTEAFGLFDETGRQLQEGELTQQQGEDAIDAYLSRRHGGDQSKVRADKMIDGRPMSYQELVNAYGDEVFARISEDFGTGNPIKNIRPGMIFSAVRNRLSRLREYVLRATGGKTDVAQVDALEKAAGNPMLQAIAREFWRTRKALKTATFKDSSKLTAAVTPKKLTRGKNAVANVNRYAGTGMFRTNADGKVLAENGEVFSAKPGERVAIIPQAERNKMAKRAVEAINATLDSLGEQDDGMFPSESKTGKPFWVGIPNEAQLAAILALPDSTVPRILKQRIERTVEAARSGDTLGVDYNKALTGRKYDTLAEMEYRLVAPFGFRISQAGNFLAMLFDIGKLNEKVDTRFKNKPKWFSEWADDTDPTGREGFYRTLREALERQRQGIKNNRDNTVGYDKILQLLNIDRLDADVGGSPTGLIRSFRVDRMNEIQTAEPKGFRIDYSRYKNPATFKPNPQEVKAQSGDDVRFMAGASKKTGLTKERRASAISKEKEIKELNKANPEAVRLELKTDNDGRPKFPKDSDKAGVKQVGYALRNAPGLSSNDEVAVQQAANKLEPVVREAMKNPEVKKGIGWYQRMRQFLQRNFGANIEIFGQMLGATSAQTPVDTNFIYTLEALRLLSRGEYDDLLADYHKHVTSITGKTELEVFNEWKERNPKKRESEFSYSDEVIRQVNLFKDQPLRANGRRFGANSDQVLQVLYGNWLDQVKGPKTPNFAGNLTGRTLAATIDVWAARTMRRILYQGKIKRWRLHPQQEKGVDYNRKNDGTYTGDFPFAQQVFAEVAERVGMAPDDLQALIWFAEKDVWAKNGWTNEVGAKKSSFDDEAAKLDLERLQAGVTTYTDESRYQQEQQEAERQVLRKTIGSIAGLEVSRVTHSDGLYEGTVEPTLDVEFSAERGTDVRPVVEQVVNMAKDHDQWDAFVSLVVGADHPNARPSVEIGFQGPASTSQINAVVNAFDANGVKGFTVAKDERGNAIGVRSQYIPEIEGRWGDATHLDPGAFPENAKAWVMNMQKALAQLDGMENISYVEPGHVSTTVYGKEEYGQAEQADLRRTDASAELGRRVSILGR